MSKLLPPNSTKFEMNFESAFSRVSNIEVNIRSFNDPLNAPVEVLPWLAWERSDDVWNKDWTEIQKRQVIQTSLKNHSIKGTIGSIARALNSLGFPIVVQEWFNMVPQGKPYTFNIFIKTSQNNISKFDFKELTKVVRTYKNLRSHLTGISLVLESTSSIYTAAAVITGQEIEFAQAAGGLYLDGTWLLDGSYRLNGVNLSE